MPSSVNNATRPQVRKASTKPGMATSRSVTQQQLNRRAARAARRAAERRRRNAIFGVLATVLVIGLAFLLFHDKLPSSGGAAGVKQTYNCPAPTATQSASMQYMVLHEGCGPAAQKGDTVTVTYTGWTQADGKEFDSSLSHAPYTFQVTGLGSDQPNVIQGWNWGLIGMKPGETRRLIIPASLGYGAQGSPPAIPPNATLVFDITLVSIDSHS
jgi:hypothetical protein